MPYLKKASTKKFEDMSDFLESINRKVINSNLKAEEALSEINKGASALEMGLAKFVTADDAMLEVKMKIRKLHQRPEPVLITGASGTGKELLAKALKKDGEPFVAENCAAIPTELVESTFFGHTKGAFTGAHTDRQGLLLEAGEGIIFLDEIGDMSLGHQAKFLRAIQEGTIRRVGSTEEIDLDCRFVAATKYNLAERVEKGLFREDLFARLMTFEIHVTPLVDRWDDVALITESMMPTKEAFAKLPPFPPSIVEKIKHYNVRGIETALARWRAYGTYE